jgi:V/A-type H+-transporting ATPase subunit E
MENKLQELTQKIYAEGIQKAEDEKTAILENAQMEAANIVQQAKDEAENIVQKAKQEAEEIRKNVNAELKLSANQAISSIKQKITDLIMLKTADKPVKDAFMDKDFIKELITTLVKNWSGAGAGISLLLPQKEQDDLGKYFETKQKDLLDQGLSIDYDNEITSGFRIGPADGSYRISFSDEDFSNFLKTYLRPRTNQLLYGGE